MTRTRHKVQKGAACATLVDKIMATTKHFGSEPIFVLSLLQLYPHSPGGNGLFVIRLPRRAAGGCLTGYM